MKQCGGVLGLTSDSRPAQRSVLSQDSADGVLVVVQRHGPLGAEALLVVPHEGAVADFGSCRRCKREGRRPDAFSFTLLAVVCVCVSVCLSVCGGVEFRVGGLQRPHLMGGSVPTSHRRTPASCHRGARRRRCRLHQLPPPSCLGSCSWWCINRKSEKVNDFVSG